MKNYFHRMRGARDVNMVLNSGEVNLKPRDTKYLLTTDETRELR